MSGDRAPDWRARGQTSEWLLWLLVDANRWLLSAVLLVAVFASLLALGVADPVGLRSAVEASDSVETVFQAFVTAIVTGVTLVVTINQLVLSQELGPVGDQRERMQGAMAFREDVEAELDLDVAPGTPSAFLRAVLEAVADLADALRAAVADDARPGGEAVREVAGAIASDAREVRAELEGADFGTFAVLGAALDFGYARAINRVRTLRATHDAVAEGAGGEVDALVDALALFGPAREHVKTLYFQWALIALSRAMLYTSVPALVVSVAAILFLDDPGSITGTTAGVDNLLLVVAGAATLATTPFVVLLAYVLRIATVARRTLAIGPFVLVGDEE